MYACACLCVTPTIDWQPDWVFSDKEGLTFVSEVRSCLPPQGTHTHTTHTHTPTHTPPRLKRLQTGRQVVDDTDTVYTHTHSLTHTHTHICMCVCVCVCVGVCVCVCVCVCMCVHIYH